MIKDICNHGLLRTICRKCSGSMTNLDKIDLKLFKFCHQGQTATIPKGKDYFVFGSLWLDRFTTSPTSCFSVLIPEMNRRGLRLILSQLGDNWTAEFVNSLETLNKGIWNFIATDPQPAVAICLAAIKTLSKTDSTLHKQDSVK